MLKGNAIFFKRLQYLSAKANFRVHHILLNIDGTKALLSGNTGNDILGFLAGTSHNPGAIVLRGIGITDIDGNPLLTDRENSILMQYRCSHIGKLPKLSIGNYLNPLGAVNDSGVCNQETGNIGPVLIYISLYSLGNDGARYVRASSGEGLYPAVGKGTIKSRNYCILAVSQSCRQYSICLLRIKFTVLIKENNGCCINKLISQIICHDDSVQILTPGSRIIASGFFLKVLLDGNKFLVKTEL